MSEDLIYKICTRDEWQAAQAAGLYNGSSLDLRDGYIHFSAASQVRETAAKYFSGQPGLVLVQVDGAALGESLKWEAARGQLFPHLYGALPLSAVRALYDLPLDEAGQCIFPGELGEGAQ